MKGKYPKTVRTSPVIIDVQGAPPKASGYQRLSEKEQEVVNQYVENLVAADVVEPCSGQWSSPILLVPKKDGSLRATPCLTPKICWTNWRSLYGSARSISAQLSGSCLSLKSLETALRSSEPSKQLLAACGFTCCVVYIDDVVIHSKGSFEDHMAKVQAALRALRVVGFSGNPAKCKFRSARGRVLRSQGDRR